MTASSICGASIMSENSHPHRPVRSRDAARKKLGRKAPRNAHRRRAGVDNHRLWQRVIVKGHRNLRPAIGDQDRDTIAAVRRNRRRQLNRSRRRRWGLYRRSLWRWRKRNPRNCRPMPPIAVRPTIRLRLHQQNPVRVLAKIPQFLRVDELALLVEKPGRPRRAPERTHRRNHLQRAPLSSTMVECWLTAADAKPASRNQRRPL
jgi:hypothetical protein